MPAKNKSNVKPMTAVDALANAAELFKQLADESEPMTFQREDDLRTPSAKQGGYTLWEQGRGYPHVLMNDARYHVFVPAL